jgi:predicted carbohydrate-binding protein with CBM5 and CBM33 domain
MKYSYSKTILTGRDKSIRINGDSDNQRSDKWSFCCITVVVSPFTFAWKGYAKHETP